MYIMKEVIEWEVSLIEFKQENKLLYKVTRRMPFFSVAETKVFSSKQEALEQLQEWLSK